MGKINMELTVPTLLMFTDKSLSRGEYYHAVQNLNEAMTVSSTDEERKKIFHAYADLFMDVGNFAFAEYALYRAAKIDYKGGNFCLHFSRFMPDANIPAPIEEEEEPISAENVLHYNEVYELIGKRRYKEALGVLQNTPFCKKCMFSIVDALFNALRDDKFDLEAYIISLFNFFGDYASEDAEVVDLLLSGTDTTRLLAIEGAGYLSERIDDVLLLCDIGEVYYLHSEFHCAKLFFEKALSICEIDDKSIYYLYAISTALKEEKEALSYKAKYFELCKFTKPPVEIMMNNASASEREVCEYLSLTKANKRAVEAKLGFGEIIDEPTMGIFKQYCCLADTGSIMDRMQKLFLQCEKTQFMDLCNDLLESVFVEKETKTAILYFMIDKGCEGTLCHLVDNRAIICPIAKLHHRYGPWNQVYKKITELILTADIYIPYNTVVLDAAMKKCYARVPFLYNGDTEFGVFVGLMNYIHRLPENVDIHIADLIALTPLEIQQLAQRYDLESIIL